jgi:hypothetical protein
MTPEEKPICNTKATAKGSGQTQPMPTTKKAEDLTAEERAKINFGWKVYGLIYDLEAMLRCNRNERTQLSRFVDACYVVLNEGSYKLYLEAEASRDFRNFEKRKRAMQFTMFEKMGEMIDPQDHE